MGFEVPNVYEYVRQLVINLNSFIDECISSYKRPLPIDVLNFLGQNYSGTKMRGLLFDVISLKLSEKRYKIDNKNPDKIEIIPFNERTDYSKLATDILRILDVTNEEIKQKEKEDRALSLQKQIDNFKPWLNDDIEE